MSVAVVNRDLAHEVKATIEIAGDSRIAPAAAYELNAASVDCSNSFEAPDEVRVVKRTFSGQGQNLTYAFPAHSVTVLRLE